MGGSIKAIIDTAKEADRDGIRLAGGERILGRSRFVEQTLEQTGEAYERRLRMEAGGLDLGCSMPPADFSRRRKGSWQPCGAGGKP